jgi:hypothetical protein
MTNELFEKLDGKNYTHNGIPGKLKHGVYKDRFNLTVNKLYHQASAKGKKTAAYLAIKATLGDDWDTDLTNNIDLYCEIARKLGIS